MPACRLLSIQMKWTVFSPGPRRRRMQYASMLYAWRWCCWCIQFRDKIKSLWQKHFNFLCFQPNRERGPRILCVACYIRKFVFFFCFYWIGTCDRSIFDSNIVIAMADGIITCKHSNICTRSDKFRRRWSRCTVRPFRLNDLISFYSNFVCWRHTSAFDRLLFICSFPHPTSTIHLVYDSTFCHKLYCALTKCCFGFVAMEGRMVNAIANST